MASASERWSDKKLIKTIDGNWTYQRGWDVVGYSNEADAIAATNVIPGDSHPANDNLVCLNISLVENKLTKGIVRATYSISNIVADAVNPIDRPFHIKWGRIHNKEPIDLDYNGNPILNSALDVGKKPQQRNFSSRTLRLTRYEPFFDQDQSDAFTDTVNAAAISFEGYDYDAGQVYCHDYMPAEDYQKDAPFVKVFYDFEIRTPNAPNLTTLQKRHPFQLRIMDQGLRAYYTDPIQGDTLGHLFTFDGIQITRDVLLDGTGVPLDETIGVTQGWLEPVPQTLPDDVLLDTTDSACFLIYMIYPEVDFTAIGT